MPISNFQPIRLLDLGFWYKFTLMTNSADPDQLASSEANWSGPTLFAKTGHVMFSKRRVNKNVVKNTLQNNSMDLQNDICAYSPKSWWQWIYTFFFFFFFLSFFCFRNTLKPLYKMVQYYTVSDNRQLNVDTKSVVSKQKIYRYYWKRTFMTISPNKNV